MKQLPKWINDTAAGLTLNDFAQIDKLKKALRIAWKALDIQCTCVEEGLNDFQCRACTAMSKIEKLGKP